MSPRYSNPILITGITSFVGSRVAKVALDQGYKVRGTVRSQAKADDLAERPEFADAAKSGALTFAIVEDLVTGDFTEAVKGVEAIAHVASPFHLQGTDMEADYLKPAQQGTLNVIKAAKQAGTVKHVALTSSFAAVIDLKDDKLPYNGKTYTAADWSPATYEEAKATDQPRFAYCASKKVAEQAAWDFVKTEAPGIKLSVFCPPMVMGPTLVLPKDLSKPNESLEQIYKLLTGQRGSDIPPTGTPAFADVRDLAAAHIAAIDKDVGGRFLIYSGSYDHQRVVDLAHKLFPDETKDKTPVGEPGNTYEGRAGLFALDTTPAKRELGITFRTFDETFGDMIKQLVKAQS